MLQGPACEGSAHQDHRPQGQDCRCVQEEVKEAGPAARILILRNCWRHLHHHAALLKGHPLCISEKKKEKKFTMTLQMQCTH